MHRDHRPVRIALHGYTIDEPGFRELGVSVVDSDPDVTIWRPSGIRSARPCVAYLPVAEDKWELVHPAAAAAVAQTADAYAGEVQSLESAWVFALQERGPSTGRGLLFLGSLGTRSTGHPVGHFFPIEAPVWAGRSSQCAVPLRHGAHSDQNLCAREHAQLMPAPDGLMVHDAHSTNGTFIDGKRADGPTLASVGSEIAFAGCLRFLVR